MSEYYVGVFAFNDYNAISHARTKGSKNGISTTKGYIPIGQRAQGRWDPSLGRYVYSTGVERARSKVNAVAGYAGNRAKRAASGAYNKASSAARTAYGNASRAVSGAYGSAYRNVSRNVNKALDYVTGRKVNQAKRNSEANRKLAKLYAGDAQAHYLNSLNTGGVQSTINSELQKSAAASATASRLKKIAASEAEYARKQYEKTLPGRIERFGRNASKFASDSYSKVKNWISTAGSKASKAISSARSTLRKYGSMAVSSIKTAASSTAGKVKNFLSGLFKKKKKSTGTLKVVGTGGRVGTTHGPHKRWD